MRISDLRFRRVLFRSRGSFPQKLSTNVNNTLSALTGKEVEHSHPNGHAALNLIQKNGGVAVGHIAGDFYPAIDRPRVRNGNLDRKNVAVGRGVSVRVDLGGRGTDKKKIKL